MDKEAEVRSWVEIEIVDVRKQLLKKVKEARKAVGRIKVVLNCNLYKRDSWIVKRYLEWNSFLNFSLPFSSLLFLSLCFSLSLFFCLFFLHILLSSWGADGICNVIGYFVTNSTLAKLVSPDRSQFMNFYNIFVPIL